MSRPPKDVETLRHATDYRAHRVSQGGDGYPEIGDTVDALIKAMRSFIDAGLPVPPETVAIVERCEAVKQRFAKAPGEATGPE